MDDQEIQKLTPSCNGRLTEELVRAARSTSVSLTRLSAVVGVSVSALSAARNGRTWAAFEPETIHQRLESERHEGLPRDAAPLEGFPGYFVTPRGFVWSVRQTPFGRRLRGSATTYGHRTVRLCDANGTTTDVLVHRAVLLTFVGDPPVGKPFCLHSDGNPENNALENLRWGSPSENNRDAVAHGTLPNRKLSADDAVEIFHSQKSSRELAVIYGVTQQHVGEIRAGRCWRSATGGDDA
jgi:hypothetical protein